MKQQQLFCCQRGILKRIPRDGLLHVKTPLESAGKS